MHTPSELTQARYTKITERDAREAGWGNTEVGRTLAQRYLHEVVDLVAQGQQYLKKREHGDDVAKLPHEVVALTGVTTAIHSVIEGHTIGRLCLALGAALEGECYGLGLRTWDIKRATQMEQAVTRKHRNLKYRQTALRSLAQRANFPWKKWTAQERAMAGRWLAEILLESSLFIRDEAGNPTMTEAATSEAADIVMDLQARHPVLLPVTERPTPWDDTHRLIDGYRVSLVRSRDEGVHRAVRGALRSGALSPSLEALNTLQDVPWRINDRILSLVEDCYRGGIPIPGLPPKDDIPLPPRLQEPYTKAQLSVHIKSRADIRQLNRAYLGERLSIEGDLATASHLSGTTFWTHLNWDYRGRIYGIPRFNFQRQDYVRAMFEFSEGAPVTPEGLNELRVHVANCGDFEKVSKRPRADRLAWTLKNESTLCDVARDPMEHVAMWSTADKPFLFVAACMALADALEGLPVRLPVAADGSCSGLQHLAAMTRCEATAPLVNLVPLQEPADVYQTVADKALRIVRADADAGSEVAQRCLDYGVDRSLVKRNVMTFSYSSKAYGMAEQHMVDTMQPLMYAVLRGDIPEHPFGPDGGLEASRYLAVTILSAIQATVKRPAEAMTFLQGIARTMAHEGKPVTWLTPMGFPVYMRYAPMTTNRVKLLLHDKGVPYSIKPRIAEELKGIDKRRAASAIAPSFVHSYDACHLMAATLYAKDEGIVNTATVHDSFSCHPNMAGDYRVLVRQAFCDLYKQNDVLFDVLRQSAADLSTNWHRLPDAPDRGTYDINSIIGAEYAFA